MQITCFLFTASGVWSVIPLLGKIPPRLCRYSYRRWRYGADAARATCALLILCCCRGHSDHTAGSALHFGEMVAGTTAAPEQRRQH